MADESENLDKLMRLLKERSESDSNLDKGEADRRAALVKKHYETMMNGEDKRLTKGMLVQWKPGLKNRKRPRPNEPGIVIEILENPVYDKENGSGSPYFNEPLDLVVGVIDEDDDLSIFHYDKRRFMPYSSD